MKLLWAQREVFVESRQLLANSKRRRKREICTLNSEIAESGMVGFWSAENRPEYVIVG
jgi:hypothetical protein